MTKWLLLIPTKFEHEIVAPSLSNLDVPVEICGFGPVASAARATKLIVRHHPDRVLLLGIAGSYDPELSVGNAFQFSNVACYGVGVGTGESFQTAKQMGWLHWHGDDDCGEISDNISLKPGSADPMGNAGQLLTVCAASQNHSDAKMHQRIFPNAVAEDMEGFAVAVACQMANVPLAIVRGISNVAGERDKQNWKIKEALDAAAELAGRIINGVGDV